jgi:hypothetical protein
MWKNLFIITIQFVINVQLKDLTHKFYLSILSHKLPYLKISFIINNLQNSEMKVCENMTLTCWKLS